MVEGCDGLMGDHGSWVKLALLFGEKKAAGVVKLTSACRGLGRVASCVRHATCGLRF